ncbi:hypothetical protein Pelo_9685 [Pelomyxa schiedti]|nr:hypothetical protein Pelo_9685 [Pelomyxa schiedti]
MDFAGWSLMLRMFPTITKEAVIDHFLDTIAQSPLLVLWPDIVANEEYLTAAKNWDKWETIWWLQDQGLLPETTTTPNTDNDHDNDQDTEVHSGLFFDPDPEDYIGVFDHDPATDTDPDSEDQGLLPKTTTPNTDDNWGEFT